MRRSGLLVYQILQQLEKMVEEGVTTQELEDAAEKMMKDAGAKPAFKGYYTQAAGSKYPYVLCTSVNEQIVHGMPSAKNQAEEGRYRFHRYRRSVERIFWRLGHHGSGGRNQRFHQAAFESYAGIAGVGHR